MHLLCQSLILYMDSRSKPFILFSFPKWYRGKSKDSGVSPGLNHFLIHIRYMIANEKHSLLAIFY